VKRGLVVLSSLAAVLFAAPAGSAATAAFTPCGQNGLQCATLTVPLDYSGATAGQVSLYVEELPAAGTPKGVMLMLAGGPGQASAETFKLGPEAALWRSYFPGYTLVAYDDRGTGNSGPLACPNARTIADCGNAIAGRAYYTTREHAEDIESVRQALGVDKLAIWGVSYGTKHAVAYALAHPTHVERLLLDSEVLPVTNPLDTTSLQTVTTSINRICTNNACPGIAPGVGDRFAALANKLQTAPVDATLHMAPSLGGFPVHLDGNALLGLAFESDLSSGISSQLPTAVDAALAGQFLPLERLVFLDALSNSTSAGDVNIALLLATDCGDGPFPWQPADPVATRQAALTQAIAGLPPGASGPFGGWALDSLLAWNCVSWPAPSGGAALGAGPLPDVPVLVLSGDRDIRTPTPNALAIATRFPQAHVLLVPGAGHSVLNHSKCAADAVRGWLDGTTPPAVCTKFSLYVPPLGAWRRSVAATPPAARVPGLPGKTLAAVLQTLHDAEDVWLVTRNSQTTVNGLAAGSATPNPTGTLRLQGFSAAAGLTVSGTIVLKMDPYGNPVVPLTAASGTLTIGGRGASHGTVRLAGNRLTGTLARRKVAATF
jgi:pimeloyl-ACP methyl ester carboxylesterase